MYEAKSIYYRRGGKDILHNVDVTLEAGAINIILGPNGAGKSTLLHQLTGNLKPDQGEVFFEGEPLDSISILELARRRAVLAQETTLGFDFSVEEVVMLGRIPHLSGWGSPHDEEACRNALIAVEMESYRFRRYPTLSGGEKQRVNLARVLAQLDLKQPREKPAWLFLDEPTSALDLRHQHTTLFLMASLVKKQGLGVCAILHDINLAFRYAEHVVLLSDGEVAASGPPEIALTCETIEAVYQVQARLHPATSDCPAYFQTLNPAQYV